MTADVTAWRVKWIILISHPDFSPPLCLCPTVLSQQMMIMEMFIICLVNRFLYRRTYDALPSEEQDNDQNAKFDEQKVLEEHDV